MKLNQKYTKLEKSGQTQLVAIVLLLLPLVVGLALNSTSEIPISDEIQTVIPEEFESLTTQQTTTTVTTVTTSDAPSTTVVTSSPSETTVIMTDVPPETTIEVSTTTIEQTTTQLETTTSLSTRLPEENITTTVPKTTTIPETTTAIPQNQTTTTILPIDNITSTFPESTTTITTTSSTTTTLETTTIPQNETTTTQLITTIPETTIPLTTIPQTLRVQINSPDRVTRGQLFSAEAVVESEGLFDNVVLTWQLPEGFEIISGSYAKNCGSLAIGSVCSSNITVKPSASAELGKDDIKAVVSYETR